MDTLSNFLISIKNGGSAKKDSVCVPYSKFKMAVAELLEKEGYIASTSKKGRKIKKKLEVGLKYNEDGSAFIKDVKRVSKLSKRIYYSASDIRPVKRGHGSLILSTPKGIMTGNSARKENVGGEALFLIW